jgi:hypothetical protein
MNDKKVLTLLDYIYDSAYCCISYTNYFEIITLSSQNKRGSNFLNTVQNALGDEACIYWTHIFGNENDDNHLYYEHFFGLCNEEGYRKEDIRKRLLSVTGYDETEYNVFRDNIIKVRNKFLAHKAISEKRYLKKVNNEDINNFSTTYPDLIVCKKMAKELLVIIKELVDKWLDDKYDPTWRKNPDDYYSRLVAPL